MNPVIWKEGKEGKEPKEGGQRTYLRRAQKTVKEAREHMDGEHRTKKKKARDIYNEGKEHREGGQGQFYSRFIFNRPGVAGAVLQTPP